MARLTVTQKTSRVLKFLEASADPRVNPPMAAAGYGSADLQEGWELLKRAGTVRLSQPQSVAITPRVREQLDQFENYWFPMVSATLQRRHPDLHEKLFLNLGQEDGVEVSLNVSIFLGRLKEIAAGPQGAEVMALLEKRGLSAEVISGAEALLADFTTVQPAPSPDLASLKKEHEQAVNDLWAWYLEWSTIARTVIQNRRHLKMLGFLNDSSSSSEDEPSEVFESGFPAARDEESLSA